jgi:hypothetical protein
MSAPIMATGAAGDLQEALLSAVRADAGVTAYFGPVARVLDEDGEDLAYPYAVLERHEVRPAGASDVAASEHVFSFAVFSRHGGRIEAVRAVQALRHAIEAAPVSVPGHHIVFSLVTYADVLRAANLKRFRGIVRARFILERTQT